MTSSFKFTMILAGEGAWKNQRYVLLTRYKHNLHLVRYCLTSNDFGDLHQKCKNYSKLFWSASRGENWAHLAYV